MATSKPVINRVTMFKIPRQEDRDALAEGYKKMQRESLKDGKPYILSSIGGPALDEARSKGYTFVSQTRFASLEDMQHYDTSDTAHAELKAGLKDKVSEPPLVIFFEDVMS
ncbi:MAG: hypothetical protein Q9162_000160 [Coniocarpon cinnabarinum]